MALVLVRLDSPRPRAAQIRTRKEPLCRLTTRTPGTLERQRSAPVDTLDVRPLPGVVLKHFTARDVVSPCDVLQVGARATSASAAKFLSAIIERMPFPVRAIQVDGGSEFQGEFEEACRERGVRLFVLPPHSPNLNGYVERGAPDACRGVLQLLRRGVDDGAVEPRAAGVGGVLQRAATASVAWLAVADGVS